jgi:hypothetical protein
MITQLDSLSMATDNNVRQPTVSKFPKTRPSELSCKQGETGQEIALVANYIKVLATPQCIKNITKTRSIYVRCNKNWHSNSC